MIGYYVVLVVLLVGLAGLYVWWDIAKRRLENDKLDEKHSRRTEYAHERIDAAGSSIEDLRAKFQDLEQKQVMVRASQANRLPRVMGRS